MKAIVSQLRLKTISTKIAAIAIWAFFGLRLTLCAQIVSYPMDEPNWSGSAPQVHDASGNGHNGTVVGNAKTVLDAQFGYVGSFAGSYGGPSVAASGYVTVGGPSKMMSGARSIVAWVNLPANGSSWAEPIVTGGSSVWAGDAFGIGGENMGFPQYRLYVDHFQVLGYASAEAITPGQWTFVALTYDGSNTVHFYIDGADAGCIGNPSQSMYDYDVTTYTVGGKDPYGSTTMNTSLNGLLRDVGIYDTALTPMQIEQLYAATGELTITAQPQSQVGYWGMAASFSVGVAGGRPPYSFQWLVGGVPIAGATNSGLVLTNLLLTDTGTYTVVVSDSLTNTATSNPATLIVKPANVSLGLYAGLTLAGEVGKTLGIQYSTNLADTNSWSTISNITLMQPVQLWVDTSINVATNGERFYRVVAVP
jgi:hypothetical protein